jgi:hypothetical protein
VLRKIHEGRGDRIEHRRSDEPPSRRPWREWFTAPRPVLLDLINLQRENEWNQHGRVDQIPFEDRHKPILTTLRNPFDRYVSQYEFKWWKTHPHTFFKDVDRLKQVYPHYPELSFGEFLEASTNFYLGLESPRFSLEDRLGRHTLQFIAYFYQQPEKVVEIDADYLVQRLYHQDICPRVSYIFMEDLNRQLHAFLNKMGYSADEISFILDHGKVFPREGGRNNHQTWEAYYTPELKAYVRHRERMLFDLFPEFDGGKRNE